MKTELAGASPEANVQRQLDPTWPTAKLHRSLGQLALGVPARELRGPLVPGHDEFPLEAVLNWFRPEW